MLATDPEHQGRGIASRIVEIVAKKVSVMEQQSLPASDPVVIGIARLQLAKQIWYFIPPLRLT